MAQSRLPGPTSPSSYSFFVPDRTPGPLGMQDAADPNELSPPGDTPGSLGINDGAALLAAGGSTRRRSRRSRSSGYTVILISGGYPAPTEAEEAALLERQDQALDSGGTITESWSPNTEDFRATARDTLPSTAPIEVTTADRFLSALKSAPGPIRRVIFIGHGSTGGLTLGGGIDQSLSISDLISPAWASDLPLIQAKFRDDATFDIYACNVAAGARFTKALATAFDVRVRAFDGPVYWCIRHNPKTMTIRSRGRVSSKDSSNDCSSAPWRKGVLKWAPPQETLP